MPADLEADRAWAVPFPVEADVADDGVDALSDVHRLSILKASSRLDAAIIGISWETKTLL